jgi:hypothetical protein
MPVRVHLGPDHRISPALRSELYPILAQPPTRSEDDRKKSASLTWAGHSVTTLFTLQGRRTESPAVVLDDHPRHRRAGERPRDLPPRTCSGEAPRHRSSAGRPARAGAGPGHAKAPGTAGRTGRFGSGRPALPGACGGEGGGVSRPVTGARAGKLGGEGGEGLRGAGRGRAPGRAGYCAWRSRSAISASTLTKLASWPPGTIA